MTIREFTVQDIKSVVELQSGSFKDGWKENMLKSAFDTGRAFGFLSVHNEGVSGYVLLSALPPEADLETVFVKDVLRSQGVGTALLESAFLECKNRGVEKVFLEVRESNLNAINLYKKFGFKHLSVRKKYYPDGENALVMQKEL
ncbi:MAG: ribosomal-protein-alanine N-acetyltransferase [Clostridiales bacterium]|nr:ribosomal-protein-alanine N-acetyltransferase [Clostridiales bacterium]